MVEIRNISPNQVLCLVLNPLSRPVFPNINVQQKLLLSSHFISQLLSLNFNQRNSPNKPYNVVLFIEKHFFYIICFYHHVFPLRTCFQLDINMIKVITSYYVQDVKIFLVLLRENPCFNQLDWKIYPSILLHTGLTASLLYSILHTTHIIS